MQSAFLLFHHNLAFSTVAEYQREHVIRKCYVPLLDFIENTRTKVCIEAPGWTLKECERWHPEYIDRLKYLIDVNLVELVGSGYCQTIAPLVPFAVNMKNQEMGLQIYESLLGVRPTTALVNEMAFSPGLIDVLSASGYTKAVMDGDNVAEAASLTSKLDLIDYNFFTNARGSKLEMVWSDSVIFQKFQRVIHGTLSLDSYLDDIRNFISTERRLVPIYTNDIEIFNFRPGRFKEESSINGDEWLLIAEVIAKLKSDLALDFTLLKDSSAPLGRSLQLDGARNPVAVKKQPKYNILRWAVTGRADAALNTICYRRLARLQATEADSLSGWRELCLLWSSDLRTHIEEGRWHSMISVLDEDESSLLGVTDERKEVRGESSHFYELSAEPYVTERNGRLHITTPKVAAVLNITKGGSVESLKFEAHDFDEVVGGFSHGELNDINYAADFFSGGVIIEDLSQRSRFTDYMPVSPSYSVNDDSVDILFTLNLAGVRVHKLFTIGIHSCFFDLSFNSGAFGPSHKVIRLGNFLLKNTEAKFTIETSTGGAGNDRFSACGEFDHAKPVSSLVSAKTGFGSPDGFLTIEAAGRRLRFEWDNSVGYLFPMMQKFKVAGTDFVRLIFSKSELDDTSQPNKVNLDSKITIRPD